MAIQHGKPLVRIGVIGIGGAGCNTIKRMVEERTTESGAVCNNVVLIAANTDIQDLEKTGADKKIQLGPDRTKGLGAGADPVIGREAAEESRVEIANEVSDLDMLFVTAGMGGGTGTGAAPVIAEIARSAGILTVAMVTTPFLFEGRRKMTVSQEGIKRLRENADTIVVISNEKLLALADEHLSCEEAFRRSDDILIHAVRSLTDLTTSDAIIHVDFADVRAAMMGMGDAVIGVGEAAGENAVLNAVREALENPLLSDADITGARRALFYVGGMEVPMRDFQAACQHVFQHLDEDALFKWGIGKNKNADKVHAFLIVEATRSDSASPLPATGMSNVAKKGTSLTIAPESQVPLFEVSSSSRDVLPHETKVAEPMSAQGVSRGNAEPHIPVPISTSIAEARSEHKMQRATLDFDEKIVYRLPDNINADPDDPHVPTIMRQMMRQQKAKEGGRNIGAGGHAPSVAPPAPAADDYYLAAKQKEMTAKKVETSQSTATSTAMVNKKGNEHR